MDSEKLREACLLGARPVLDRLVADRSVSARKVNAAQGVASLGLTGPDGRKGQFAVERWMTEEGPKATFLRALVHLWTIEYRLDRGKQMTEQVALTGALRGLER